MTDHARNQSDMDGYIRSLASNLETMDGIVHPDLLISLRNVINEWDNHTSDTILDLIREVSELEERVADLE